MTGGNAISLGQLRVFISSTFADMNAERDELIKMFPQIGDYCSPRGVEFVPLDLRWGITENAAREGRVLETCLREIDNSRPFFIGIIGNRYGWVPCSADLGSRADSLRGQYPWLGEALDAGMSITEMEMQYAALQQLDSGGNQINAAFFIRSDKMAVPDEFCEKAGSDNDSKLRALKQKISSQKKFAVQYYDSPEQLAGMVRDAIKAFADKEFPYRSAASFDADARKQELRLASRSKSLFDLSRYDSVWQRWVRDSVPGPLLIKGYPGRGKSYLLAHVAGALRSGAGDPVVVYYDCEGESDGDNTIEYISTEIFHRLGRRSRKSSERRSYAGCLWSMLRILILSPLIGVLTSVRMAFGNQDNAKMQMGAMLGRLVGNVASSDMRRSYADMQKLLKKSPDRPLYVVIDHIGSLPANASKALVDRLTGLPYLRLVVAADTGSATDNLLTQANATVLDVKNLDISQAREYVRNYLAQYGKALDEQGVQCDKIVNSKVGGVPRLLSYILNLMVCFGSFEELDRYITDLAAVEDQQKLYELIIRNIGEQFAENGYADVANRALMTLAVVRGGLTEDEIKETFNPSPLAWAMVSPYVLNLCRRRGKLLYLQSDLIVGAVKAVLADYADKVIKLLKNHFEGLLTIRVDYKDALGNSDTDKILDDNRLRQRQVEVLMPLYYAGAEHNRIDAFALYNWATYADADQYLTHETRLRYWQRIYQSHYFMRDMDEDPDRPPCIKMMPAAQQLYLSHIPKNTSTIKSIRPMLANFYFRLHKVAVALHNDNDARWLSHMILTDKDRSNRFGLMTMSKKLVEKQDYDNLMVMAYFDYVDDTYQFAIDTNAAMACYIKGYIPRLYELTHRNYDKVKRDGLLESDLVSGYLSLYVYAMYKTGHMDNAAEVTAVLERKYAETAGDKNMSVNHADITSSLTMLYHAARRYVDALKMAREWAGCAKKLNLGSYRNAVATIADLEKIVARNP